MSPISTRTPFSSILALALLASLPASTAAADRLEIRGPAGTLRWQQRDDRQLLTGDVSVVLPLAGTASVHSLARFEDETGHGWLVAATEARGELILLRGRGEAVETLPNPARTSGLPVDSPVLLERGQAAGRTFDGLVWLEGEAREQQVRAARWTGDGWSEPVTVSPRKQGSQLAPTAVTLADGSWLVAWSAFDGEDDEILWSRVVDGQPSAPRRLAPDNAVPDITPHLLTTGGETLIAWSRYTRDHTYRVHLARFTDEGFTRPTAVGPRSGLFPRLQADPAGPVLVFRQGFPCGWWVVQLAGGEVRRQTYVATEVDERPFLLEVTAKGVTLGWEEGAGGKSLLAWQEVRP